MEQVILSLLYRKRLMLAHHDSLKLCRHGDLPKRHELRGTLGEDVG